MRDVPRPRLDGSRHVLASQLLVAIAEALAGMPDSPQKRQLGAKAASYRRTIDQFQATPPTAGQSDALDDMVLALQGKVLEVLRRDSLDLTPGPLRVESAEEEEAEEPPPSSTPLARVRLRGSGEKV